MCSRDNVLHQHEMDSDATKKSQFFITKKSNSVTLVVITVVALFLPPNTLSSVAADHPPSPAPFHTLLTRHERSTIFATDGGSNSEVPNYEVVYLPALHKSQHHHSSSPAAAPQRHQKRASSSSSSACQPVELTLTAFSRRLPLSLRPNDRLRLNRLLVVVREDKRTYVQPGLVGAAGDTCFYHGTVKGKTGGSVALAYNNGYTGIITTDEKHYIVQPAPARLRRRETEADGDEEEQTIAHVIYERHSSPHDTCGQEEKDQQQPDHGGKPVHQHFRKRRGHQPQLGSKLSIETAVFVDKELYSLMKQSFPADPDRGTVDVVLTLINAAQLLFQDETLGADIDVSLVRLEIQKTEFEGLKRSANIDQYLSSFCVWQSGVNPVNDADPLHWDHALLLTGANVYSEDLKGNRNSQVVGLAPVSGMCLMSNSCTVNEGGNFESVYVVAHEMGHSMGMQHDGPQNNNGCSKDRYLMSPTLGSGKTTWSSCSRNYLLKFLRSPQSRCLWDPGSSPDEIDHGRNSLLPGQRFNADQQCRLRFGSRSRRAHAQPLADICQDLQCVSNQFVASSHPALEGTQCGDNKYCRSGKCITVERSLAGGSSSSAANSHLPLDGAWGEWSPYTPCVSTCLYGNDGRLETGSSPTTVSFRRCDNPQYVQPTFSPPRHAAAGVGAPRLCTDGGALLVLAAATTVILVWSRQL